MYSNTNRFFLLFLILGMSLVLAEPKKIDHHTDATDNVTLYDELIRVCTNESHIIQEIYPGSLFILKAQIQSRRLVHSLQKKSGYIKLSKVYIVFKNVLTAISHEYETNNGNPVYMTDSKPKSAHSCQNLIV